MVAICRGWASRRGLNRRLEVGMAKELKQLFSQQSFSHSVVTPANVIGRLSLPLEAVWYPCSPRPGIVPAIQALKCTLVV